MTALPQNSLIYEVYAHTNIVTGEKYIGITCRGLQTRTCEHLKAAQRRSNSPFYQAIREYGWRSFETVVLAVCDSQITAFATEIEMIERYQTYDNGYNMTRGGTYNIHTSGQKSFTSSVTRPLP